MNFLCKKAVYPYEYVVSVYKLDHVGLHPKFALCAALKQGHIPGTNYQRALNVFKAVLCDSFKEHRLLYLKN